MCVFVLIDGKISFLSFGRFGDSLLTREIIMSRNLRKVEDELNRGIAATSVFGVATKDRQDASHREMPKEYQPTNTTPIRPAKEGDVPSVDFKIQALQEGQK